jgi:1-deoxy-D-xylulose-5-phosphate reductoisomerase
VIRRHRDRFNVVGISANANVEKLAAIAGEFAVENVAIGDERALAGRERLFSGGTNFFCGESGLCELASLAEMDSVLMAIVGTAGIGPTMAAIGSKKTVLLASKEVLVVAGKFICEHARKNGVPLLPIDSEHNGIFQCLRGGDAAHVDRLVLTASGGPFRSFSAEDMKNVSVEQALRHPTWAMGKKITIDSATMANKGLEVMEARWLFDVPGERIDVLIHPESIVHAMVRFCDGSVVAQMCPTNMEFPIAHCLFYPERCPSAPQTVDFAAQKSLNFFNPSTERFPSLSLARQCLNSANNACAVFQGANSVAVEKFLDGKIKFPQIWEIVAETLNTYDGEAMVSVESCMESVAKAVKIAKTIAVRMEKF